MYRSFATVCLLSALFSRCDIVSANNYVCNRDFQYNVTGPVRDIYCSADTSEPSQLEQFQVHLHTGRGMGDDSFPAPDSVYKSEPVDDEGLYYYIILNHPFKLTLFVLSLAVEVVMILRSSLYFIFRHNTNTNTLAH